MADPKPAQPTGKPPAAGTQPELNLAATQTVPGSQGDLSATLAPPPDLVKAVSVQGTAPPGEGTLPTAVRADEGDQSTPALAEDAKAGNLSTLKDYRLISKLGEGGMGAVYKAHQLSLDRIVAVKVPFRHLAKDTSFVGRFYREARIMAKLDHPNILRCYGVGEENGWHYLAMEFIDGASMQSWLKQLGKIPVGDALHVTIACCQAMQHAHDQGLIHRDIKPDNILITTKGVVKVADMGLAKALDDDLGLSRTGTGAGTPHYMAPEQAHDAKHVDARSDIYSLGCMLYSFLAGKPPFAAETYVDLILEKQKGKYPPVRRSNSTVPERLDLMIDKAIAPKPESRYKSCAEFAKELSSLGLASPLLSFVTGATATLTGSGPATQQGSAMPTVPQAPSAGKPAAAPAASGPAGKVTPGSWYVASKAASGKIVKRKMTTGQVNDLIRQKDTNLKGFVVSRTLKGPYKNLAYYKEFEHAIQGRLTTAKVDRKTEKLQNAYDKILKEEKTYYLKRWLRDKFRTATGLVTLAIFLAVLAGVIYFAWGFIGPTLKTAFEAVQGIFNK